MYHVTDFRAIIVVDIGICYDEIHIFISLIIVPLLETNNQSVLSLIVYVLQIV